jgi:hypothetical protein
MPADIEIQAPRKTYRRAFCQARNAIDGTEVATSRADELAGPGEPTARAQR